MSGVQAGRNWCIVEFETDAANEDLASWVMVQCGSTGCEVQTGKHERVVIKATFDQPAFTEEDMRRLAVALEEYALGDSLKTLKCSSIEEEDWLAKWKTGFKPFTIGERLLVTPPWELPSLKKDTPELTDGRHVIIIEPGMAFGTGLHATTQFCLRMIEDNDPGRDVLDVGTGSGILAIAVAKLYPQSETIAVDTDPVAIKTARENCQLNGVSDRIKLIQGSTEAAGACKFDSLLSNMTCEDIIALMPEYRSLLRSGGVVIGAGILAEKLNRLEESLAGQGFALEKTVLEGQWAGVVLRKVG